MSLICLLCSVLNWIDRVEKNIQKDDVRSFDEAKILNDSQHGFIKGRSCLAHILDFREEIYDKFDEGKAVDVIYLEFADAVDKLSNSRLTVKLEACGIGVKVLQWIKNWLRAGQRVGIKGRYSV